MHPSPVASLRAYLIGLIGLLVCSAVIALLSQHGIHLGFWVYVVNILFQWLVFAVPALLYYQKHPEMEPYLRLRSFDPLCALTIIMAAIVGTIVLNWIALYWIILLDALGLSVTLTSSITTQNGTELIWMLAYAVFAPAVFEEILFRGFLLPSLESKSIWFAIIISGLLFAVLHVSLEALPAHILLGFVLAMLVLSTGSLYASMLYHAVHNGVIVLINFFSTSVDATTESLLISVEEVIALSPSVLFLLFLWVLLQHFSLRRGRRNQIELLPVSTNIPLQRSAKVLLLIIGVLLLGIFLISIYSMLPEVAEVASVTGALWR